MSENAAASARATNGPQWYNGGVYFDGPMRTNAESGSDSSWDSSDSSSLSDDERPGFQESVPKRNVNVARMVLLILLLLVVAVGTSLGLMMKFKVCQSAKRAESSQNSDASTASQHGGASFMHPVDSEGASESPVEEPKNGAFLIDPQEFSGAPEPSVKEIENDVQGVRTPETAETQDTEDVRLETKPVSSGFDVVKPDDMRKDKKGVSKLVTPKNAAKAAAGLGLLAYLLYPKKGDLPLGAHASAESIIPIEMTPEELRKFRELQQREYAEAVQAAKKTSYRPIEI